jgi:hypothetical protein
MSHVNLQLEQLYPADLRVLWAALGRREYVEDKYRSLGSTDLRILAFDVSERIIEVSLERRIRTPVESVPAWARVFFAGSHVLHHHSRWTRVDSRSVEVEMQIWPLGAPVRAQGRGFVVELPDKSTHLRLSVAVQSDVPAVGSKVAQIFAKQMIRALDQDHYFTLSYLRQTAKTTEQDSIAAK